MQPRPLPRKTLPGPRTGVPPVPDKPPYRGLSLWTARVALILPILIGGGTVQALASPLQESARGADQESRRVTHVQNHPSALARETHGKDPAASLTPATTNSATALPQVGVITGDKKAKEGILRERATDPKVRAFLAPFITPGYWTPRGYTSDKRPLSYTMLLSEGALDDSPRGLNKLAKFAMAIDDKVRPRWKLAGGPLVWYKVPESVEKVKTAQQHLIELGPTLVELELLSP